MRLLLAALLLLVMISTAQEERAIECLDQKTREHLRSLMHDSVDNALRDYVKNLYTVWVRDERLDQQRMRQGVQNALRAWVRGRKAIDTWDVPECER